MATYIDKFGEVKRVEDHDKIWYDPCDSNWQYNIDEFLYLAYEAIAGRHAISKNKFEDLVETLFKEFEVDKRGHLKGLRHYFTKDEINSFITKIEEKIEDATLKWINVN